MLAIEPRSTSTLVEEKETPSEKNKDLFAKVGEVFSKALEAVYHFFSQFPWIKCCKKESFQVISNKPFIESLVLDDKEVVRIIEKLMTEGHAPIKQDLVAAAIVQFKSILSPALKMRLFETVLKAPLATQEIAILFYEALPKLMQHALKGEIYCVHGSDVFNGTNYNIHFADYMIYHQCHDQAVIKAANNYTARLSE